MENIVKSFVNLSSHIMAFGMGALTKPNQKNASDIFAFSGDMFSPVIDSKDLIQKYTEVLGKIRISSPVRFAPVMKLIAEYAKYEADHYECRNYFNVIYVTPGVLDDFQDTLDCLYSINNLPMSVTVVKISNSQLVETEDFTLMMIELDSAFNKSKMFTADKHSYLDRQYLDVVNVEDFKGKPVRFQEEIARKIPYHIQNYME